MAKKKNAYYELSHVVRIIISIIPILSLIIHLLARLAYIKRGDNLRIAVVVIIHIIFGWNVFYLLDIITTIFLNRIILTRK